MFIKKWRTALAAVLFLVSAPFAAAQTVWTVGLDPTYPPFEVVDPTGRIDGVDVHIIQAVAKASGAEVRFQAVPWNDLPKELAAGRVDLVISGMAVLTWRKATMAFSEPYYQEPQVVVSRRDGRPCATWSDVGRRGLGVQKGSQAAAALPAARVYQTTDLLYNALNRSEVDGILVDRELARQWCENPELRRHVRIGFETTITEDYAVAVAPQNTALLDQINGALRQFRDDGSLGRLTLSLEP